jgi:formate hydrogenlyase transcriptional activator
VIERAVIITKGLVLNVPLPDLEPGMSTKASPAIKEERGVNHESLQDGLDDREGTEILRALEAASGIVAGRNGVAARLGRNVPHSSSRAEVWYSRVAHTPDER